MSELEERFDRLSARDGLVLAVLAGVVLRSFHVFVTFDSTVYQLWLDSFFRTGAMAYPDHPPLFFAVAASLETFFLWFRSLGPLVYWWLLLVPAAAVIRWTRDRSPFLTVLLIYLLVYTFLVGYLGTPHEIGVIGSLFGGILAIVVAFKVGELWDESSGLYAALFMAFFWWPIVYSKTLLVDMFSAALIGAAYYLYFRFLRTDDPEPRRYVATAIVLAAALYTKYYALLILPLIALYAFMQEDETRQLLRNALPGVAAVLLFLPWLIHAGVPLFDHYAATHYLFVEPPSPFSYGTFLASVYGPVLLLAGVGAYVSWPDRRWSAAYFLGPFAAAFLFYGVNTFVLHRSHTLINLSNYMLFTLPVAAGLAGVGWSHLVDRLTYPHLLTAALLILLVAPVPLSQEVRLEYDQGYTTPNYNLNTFTADQLADHGISDYPTQHWVYSFDRMRSLSADIPEKRAHFRWMNATAFRVVALEPVTYRLDIRRPYPQTRDVAVYRNGEQIRTLSPEQENITIRAPRGSSRFSIRDASSAMTVPTPIPFVIRHRQVDTGVRGLSFDELMSGQNVLRLRYNDSRSPGEDIRRLSANIDTISLHTEDGRSIRYDVGNGSAEPPLGEGWFVAVREDGDRDVRFSRWSGDANRDGVSEAVAYLDGAVISEISITADGVGPGIAMTVMLNGERLGTVLLADHWRTYRFFPGRDRSESFK